MMTTFRIRHETLYRYGAPVAFGEHRMLLRPRDGHDQRVIEHRVEIGPEPAEIGCSEDASGNIVTTAGFGRRSRELQVVATTTVEVTAFREASLRLAEHAASCPFSYGAEAMPDLARFVERQHSDPDRVVDRWARGILTDTPAAGTWGFLTRMNAAIRRDLAYIRREEPGMQSPATTLRTGRGSCRDFAVLMSEAVRAQGLAARFVSGYLNIHSGDERGRRIGGSTHAWIQVYLPGAGWIDFDPTSGAVGNADLIRVAVVRDPSQATPISGSFMGFPSDYIGMTVDVDVESPLPLAAAVAA